MGPADPWQKKEKLSIKESDYYHLCELLVFQITLKKDGFTAAKKLVYELPMSKEMKYEMIDVLNDTFVNSVRECSLIYGEETVREIKGKECEQVDLP